MRYTTIILLVLTALAVGSTTTSPTPPKRESIEWLDVWIPDNNADARLPRVLLIGDSITRAYYPNVQQKLAGKAYVARLATSKSVGDPALIQEVTLVLSESHFNIIHFNNGMHGWDYTEDEYRQHFPEFLAAIREGAPDAKLIWATTTPVRQANHVETLSDRTARVRVRNRIAAQFVSAQNIPIDDLFVVVQDHPEYSRPDGVHYQANGVAAQAEHVAAAIQAVLETKP